MHLTAEWLASVGACPDQVASFARVFPDGTEVTQDSCRIAAENGLKFNFLAYEVFNRKQWRRYLELIEPAYKRWNQVSEPAAQRELNVVKGLAFYWVLTGN